MLCTCILYSISHDRFYIGHCENIAIRVERHYKGQVRSTKAYAPWQLMYFEECTSKAAASRREREKNKKAEFILNFC
jgi:putative endonuclease